MHPVNSILERLKLVAPPAAAEIGRRRPGLVGGPGLPEQFGVLPVAQIVTDGVEYAGRNPPLGVPFVEFPQGLLVVLERLDEDEALLEERQPRCVGRQEGLYPEAFVGNLLILTVLVKRPEEGRPIVEIGQQLGPDDVILFLSEYLGVASPELLYELFGRGLEPVQPVHNVKQRPEVPCDLFFQDCHGHTHLSYGGRARRAST